MLPRFIPVSLALLMAGVLPATAAQTQTERESRSSTSNQTEHRATDDAKRNVGGLDRAVPGENENRAYDDPEATATVNPRNAEQSQGRLHPEQDSNYDSKPGTGSDPDGRAESQPRNRNTDQQMYGDRLGRRERNLRVAKIESSNNYEGSAGRSGAASRDGYASANGSDANAGRAVANDNNLSGDESAARSFGAQRDSDYKVVESYTGRDTPGYGTDRNREAMQKMDRAAVDEKRERSSAGDSEMAGNGDKSERGSNWEDRASRRRDRSDRTSGVAATETRESGSTSNRAENRNGAELQGVERTFLRKASEGNALEVAMGRIGLERAQNKRVREFSQRLINDHGQANQRLTSLAQTNNWELNVDVGVARSKAQNMTEELSAENFDRQFIQHMVQDHQRDVKEYENAAENAGNSELRNYIQQTLPTLREHLRVAQEIHREIGGSHNNNMSSESDRKADLNERMNRPADPRSRAGSGDMSQIRSGDANNGASDRNDVNPGSGRDSGSSISGGSSSSSSSSSGGSAN